MSPDIDRVARLIIGELVPAATVEDYEAAKSLLLTDRAITSAMVGQEFRDLAAGVREFLDSLPDAV